MDKLSDMTAGDLIRRLNQQIKGWTMYHRYAVSKRIFAAVDQPNLLEAEKMCHRRHRQKSWKWIKKKYFQQVATETGAELAKGVKGVPGTPYLTLDAGLWPG